MKYKKFVFLFVLMVVILLIPQPVSDLYIRINFRDIVGDKVQLFYATDTQNMFSQEQSITSVVDKENKQVTFCLDKSLYNHLTGFRIDFTPIEELLSITSITVSSAGAIQKEYNPVVLFEMDNIVQTNDLEMSLVKPKNRTYIATGNVDPYIILTEEISRDIAGNYSRYLKTKVYICLFIVACFLLSYLKWGEQEKEVLH